MLFKMLWYGKVLKNSNVVYQTICFYTFFYSFYYVQSIMLSINTIQKLSNVIFI